MQNNLRLAVVSVAVFNEVVSHDNNRHAKL